VTELFDRRGRDRRLVMTLPAPIVELLRNVITELAEVVEQPDGEVGQRLFPRAYLDPTEETAEREWQSAVHDDLVTTRLQAINTLVADLDGGRRKRGDAVEILLDEAAETRWLTVLNDARLALGTALGVTEDEPLEFAPDDPRANVADLYALLSALQDELVAAILAVLPATGTDDEPRI